MNSFSKKILLCALVLTCCIPMVTAQEEEDDKRANLPEFVDDSRRFEITGSYILQGAGFNLIHIENPDETVFSNDLSRVALELSLTYYFDRFKTLGIEAVFGYTMGRGSTQVPPEQSDPDNPIIFDVELLDHNVFSYGGNIIYNFGYLDIVPFVSFGGGFDQVSIKEDSSFPVDDNMWHISLGMGFKYFLTEWFGAKVAVEDYFYFVGDDDALGNKNQFRLNIGAVYTF